MDDTPEDWEEKLRIKAEIEKAERATDKENKGNLAYVDAKSFGEKKGFSRDPEAFLRSGEKASYIGVALALLGCIGAIITALLMKSLSKGGFSGDKQAVGTAISIIDTLFRFMVYVAPLFAVDAIASAIYYNKKTGKKVTHMIISGTTIVAMVGIYFLVNKLIMS